MRQALAATQLALSLTLLIGALLFLATLRNLNAQSLGFDPSGVTSMRLSLKAHGYDQPRMWAYYQKLLDEVRQQPGIDGVAVAYGLPMEGGVYSSALYRPGQDPKAAPEVFMNYVSADYFNVLRTPIAQGRTFTSAETFSTTPASIVILSATTARMLFGDADPLGRVVSEPGRPVRDYTVIGVTDEARWTKQTDKPSPMAYFPFGPGIVVSGATIVARSSRPSADVAHLLQTMAMTIDPSAPLAKERTMTDLVNSRMAEQRLFARVLSFLGVVGFLLAAVGLHGLIAQMVAERAREFSIRIAVGADRSTVVALVLRQAARVTVIGVVAGLGIAWVSGRLIEAKLFGLSGRDPFIYLEAVASLVIVVAIALIGPARSALGIQPITVLRSE
jgi:predicted permease